MNTLYKILTTQYSSLIERNYSSIAKRESTHTSTNTSIVTGMALIFLIVASVFTAPANANSKENRLALGNIVLRMLTDYDVVILAVNGLVDVIDPMQPQLYQISDGDIACTNDVCDVHITYAENCTQDLHLAPSGVGTYHTLDYASCMGALMFVDANMSVWTSLSNDHPISVVSSANFMKLDDIQGEITQHQSRSIGVVKFKRKGKRILTIDKSTIFRNMSDQNFNEECRVRMRDMTDTVRVRATCTNLPIGSGTSPQQTVVVELQVDFEIFLNHLGEEVVRSSSGKITVTRINLIPGIN